MMADLSVPQGGDRYGNHVDGPITVPLDPNKPDGFVKVVLPDGVVKVAGQEYVAKTRPAPRPLFAMFATDKSRLEAAICKLDEDGASYHEICKGLWADMADMLDYLEAGEEALHGPR